MIKDDFLVIENLVPNSYLELLQNSFTRDNCWGFMPSTTKVDLKKDNTLYHDSPQLVCPIYMSDSNTIGPFFNEIRTLFYFLEDKTGIKFEKLIRIKANLTWKTDIKLPHPPHIDLPNNDHLSMVLYINESDGETIIYDKTIHQGDHNLKEIARVSPKPGRAVIFNSNRFHSSSSPNTSSCRIIINSVFKPKRKI